MSVHVPVQYQPRILFWNLHQYIVENAVNEGTTVLPSPGVPALLCLQYCIVPTSPYILSQEAISQYL